MLVLNKPILSRPRQFLHSLFKPSSFPQKPIVTKPTGTKNGTVRLDLGTYTLPQNGLANITQLHLNENLFATTQAANAQLSSQLTEQLTNLHAYPIAGVDQLQRAIAEELNINPEKILITNGSSDLLRTLFLYLVKKGDTVLMPNPGWSFYKMAAGLVEAKIDTFPLQQRHNRFVYDKTRIAAQIEATKPKLVLICSPNNPTGNVMSIVDVIALVKSYPHVNFLLDEAYYGFTDHYSVADEQHLLRQTEQGNLFITRSFSKSYGLANLRVGFAICNARSSQELSKMAPAFGIPTFSQAAAAHRITDKAFATQLKAEYVTVRAFAHEKLQLLPGLTPFQTHSNFILCQHDARWQQLDQALLKQGYMIKRETIHGQNNYFRITLADLPTIQHFMSLIEAFQE